MRRCEWFLAGMDMVIPGRDCVALVGHHYPKAGRGSSAAGWLEKMLCI